MQETHVVYDNLFPDYAVDGVRFDWAADCSVREVEILGAGRHPLVFENSRNIVARDIQINGAWNKGTGGNGYVRFARSFACELVNAHVANVRHLTFQWSSVDNQVRNSTLKTDVNFHGGYSQRNTVNGTTVRPPEAHPWSAVTRMPEGGAHWAPPDGPGNIVQPFPR